MIDPDVNFEALEISFPCASSYPYRRYDWWKDEFYKEVLKISDEAVDMNRLNGGASVLKNHDSSIVLGKVVRAWCEGEQLCVRIRFRSDNMSRDLFNDLANGTVPNVSIGYGYDPEKDVREYVNDAGETIREVEHWEAYEVSVAVGIPADPTVGFLRSADANTMMNSRTIEHKTTNKEVAMANKRELEPVESEEQREDTETETTETTTTETAETEDSETKECDGESKDERAILMKEIKNLRADMAKSFALPHIQTERRQYSLASALQYMLTGKGADMEREISDDIYKRSGQKMGGERSLMIPFNDESMRGIFSRTFSGFANVSGSGTGLVSQENKPEMFVDYVRTKIGVKNATFLTGLTGAPVICEFYGLPEVAAYWEQVVRINDWQAARFVRNMLAAMFNTLADKKIAILGFAFKADTGDTRESPAIAVTRQLLSEHAKVAICDPKALDNAKLDLKDDVGSIEYTADPETAVRGAHAIALMTDWKEFRDLDYERLFAAMEKPAFIFDGRNLLDAGRLFEIGFNVYPLGRPALTHF